MITAAVVVKHKSCSSGSGNGSRSQKLCAIVIVAVVLKHKSDIVPERVSYTGCNECYAGIQVVCCL